MDSKYCRLVICHSARGYSLEEIAHLLHQYSDRILYDAIVNSFVNDSFDIGQLPLIEFPFVFSQVFKMANLYKRQSEQIFQLIGGFIV